MDLVKNRIGFVIDNIDKAWSQKIWPNYVKSAVKDNNDLFIFPGGRINSQLYSQNLRNSVYSLVNTKNLDGLICWSASIKDTNFSKDGFLKFHTDFEPLPYVTFADKFPGHPCVDIDVYTGMKQLITHCIEVHGARKIAFLRGPDSHIHSLHRLRGYYDALKEAGLPVTEESPLVTDPVSWQGGDKAAAQLFEERGLIPGRDFDTLVGANDELAIKAINFLSRYGYSVPRDYHAIGYDNSVESLICESSLSTVTVPYFRMCGETFRILMKHMENRGASDDGPDENVFLPTKPVIRDSCGCGRSFYHRAVPEFSGPLTDFDGEALTLKIKDYLELSDRESQVFVTPVICAWNVILREKNPETDGAASEAVSSDGRFFTVFEKSIVRFFNSEKEPELLLRLLNEIFSSGLVAASHYRIYEPALQRIIFKVWERTVINAQYRSDTVKATLDSLKFDLLEIRDRNNLVECLARHLPKIGIVTAGLVLYRDDETSLWVGNYSPEGIGAVKEQPFPAALLVPDPLKQVFSGGAFLVQPLFIEARSLGYIIHTVSGFDGVIYEDIRNTVSIAIKSIFQFNEIVTAQQKVLESLEQSRQLTIQKEAAQAASEAKSQFLANVSHEIRTPMNAILGMSELMLVENLNVYQKQYMEDIRTSAMALLDIINQILDISKIHSGEMNLVPVHYDFVALIENIFSMMPFLIKNNDVVFTPDVKGDIPRYLYGDDVRLRQILLNLLGNAVKFTKTGFVKFSVEAAGTDIHFTISDSGMGIKEEDIPHLFEAFKQFDLTNNHDHRGTGLGLTITKVLVEMMKGEIGVESVYGRGTTFRVIIPAVTGDETKIHHSDPVGKVVCPPDLKILVVDDNSINLNVIGGLLRLYGIKAFEAASGRQAIEMTRENRYDLIFMDHMMPEMDGVETLRAIRALGIKTPVIALTANAVTSAKEMLLASGMDDFLSKPVVMNDLNKILIRWIPGSRVVDPPVVELHENIVNLEKLNKIDGLSAEIGLERVSGQKDLYRDILGSFSAAAEKCKTNLNEFIAAGNMPAFTIEIHSMKSSLANIGAMELSARAQELESASSRNDSGFCAAALPPFINRLEELAANLAEAISGSYQNDGRLNISPELSLILSEMMDSVKEMKYVEINDNLKELDSLNLRGALKDEIEKIKDEIIIMNYDSAMEKIQKLITASP